MVLHSKKKKKSCAKTKVSEDLSADEALRRDSTQWPSLTWTDVGQSF